MDTMQLNEEDRQYVISEIQDCQGRVMQTLVPTILAIGLIAVAETEKLEFISMGCAFAVLFSSSMYVAALTYKIFRNAAFLAAFPPEEQTNRLRWERLLSRFNGKTRQTLFCSETASAAAIYLVLSLVFLLIFHEQHPLYSSVGAAILAAVALKIFMTCKTSARLRRTWDEVKTEALSASKATAKNPS